MSESNETATAKVEESQDKTLDEQMNKVARVDACVVLVNFLEKLRADSKKDDAVAAYYGHLKQVCAAREAHRNAEARDVVVKSIRPVLQALVTSAPSGGSKDDCDAFVRLVVEEALAATGWKPASK